MEIQAEEKWRNSRREGRSSSCSRSGGGGVAAAAAAVVGVAGERRSKKAASRSFSSRCAGLVKEQRARFYIMRRCVTMLICWRDYP